jgi:hypothetical protein
MALDKYKMSSLKDKIEAQEVKVDVKVVEKPKKVAKEVKKNK